MEKQLQLDAGENGVASAMLMHCMWQCARLAATLKNAMLHMWTQSHRKPVVFFERPFLLRGQPS